VYYLGFLYAICGKSRFILQEVNYVYIELIKDTPTEVSAFTDHWVHAFFIRNYFIRNSEAGIDKN
jgi:hypothetical protein